MSKRKEGERITEAIALLLDSDDSVTTGQVAKLAEVSRQAAGNHLKVLVAAGELLHEGVGRAGHYRKIASLSFHYKRSEISESDIWSSEFAELKRRDPPILDNPHVGIALTYTFGELLNNAIDHSNSENVDVRWYFGDGVIAYEIEDDGVGVFRKMKDERGLESEFDAIGEIAKGRQTTAPQAHSGLGIYFSSRMASRFTLSSGDLVWTVDSRRQDQAIGWLAHRRIGTFLRCEVDANTRASLSDLSEGFAPSGTAGNRSTLHVGLFERNGFVSRDEAKRLAQELGVFGEVKLDFTGLVEVGQGFIDELFRVWQKDHPATRLVAVNANPAIAALLRISGYSPASDDASR